MHITSTRDALLGAIAPTAAAAARQDILGHLLFTARGSTVTVTGSDGPMRLTLPVDAQVATEGAVLLDAATLLATVRSLPAGAITVREDNSRVVVEGGGARFRLAAASVEDYPPESTKNTTWSEAGSVDGGELARVLSETMYAASADENRYGLNGLHVEVNDGTLRAVATDGSRLAWSETDEGEWAQCPVSPRSLLSLRAAKMLARLAADEVGVWAVTRCSRATAWTSPGGAVLITQLVDGEFPDYRQVIPDKWRTAAVVRVADLAAALKRADVIAKESRSHTLVLRVAPDQIRVSTSAVDGGSMAETLHTETDGPDIEIGVNARYMLDALAAAGDQVTLAMSDALDPIVVQYGGRTNLCAVVMPLRID